MFCSGRIEFYKVSKELWNWLLTKCCTVGRVNSVKTVQSNLLALNWNTNKPLLSPTDLNSIIILFTASFSLNFHRILNSFLGDGFTWTIAKGYHRYNLKAGAKKHFETIYHNVRRHYNKLREKMCFYFLWVLLNVEQNIFLCCKRVESISLKRMYIKRSLLVMFVRASCKPFLLRENTNSSTMKAAPLLKTWKIFPSMAS